MKIDKNGRSWTKLDENGKSSMKVDICAKIDKIIDKVVYGFGIIFTYALYEKCLYFHQLLRK